MKCFRLIPILCILLAMLVGCRNEGNQVILPPSTPTPQTAAPAPEKTPAPVVVSPEVKPSTSQMPENEPQSSPVVSVAPEQTPDPTPSHSAPEVTPAPSISPSPAVTVTPEPSPTLTPAPIPSGTPIPTPSPKPPVPAYNYPVAVASGSKEQRNSNAVIDYSNTSDGYVMVQYTQPIDVRLKAQVKGPKTTYTYDLTAQKWATFPLSEGDGDYTVAIYSNVSGTKYANVLSVKFAATIKSEFEPFLYPNQYVDYVSAPNAVAKAQELTSSIEQPLEKVAVVYDYVVGALTYDKQKAETVKSGYLPALDEVLAKKTGICFDYAALMTGMLRSQGVPCKLVVGYAGSAYHAWINVWTEESGWIDGAIFFDGKSWHRMDPTFASSGHRSDSIMEYIGDGTNYKEKYLY